MSAGNLLAGVLFSAIGIGAFIYGKRRGSLQPALIGLALMIYPYFTADAKLTAAIGIVLTAALFIFRG